MQKGFTSGNVILYRYTNSWTKLETKMTSQDSQNYYFEATTPGFSYFAIGAEKETTTTPTTSPPSVTNDTTQPPVVNPPIEDNGTAVPAPDVKTTQKPHDNTWWIIILVVIVVVAISLALTMRKK